MMTRVGLFLLVLFIPGLGLAESGQGLGVVSTLTGQATVRRSGSGAPVPLKFRDAVSAGDTISTAKGAVVRLLLGETALAQIREHSSLALRRDGEALTLELRTGSVGLNVAGQPKGGQTIQVLTPNARAVLGRGTVVLRAARTPKAQTQTTVYVLAGSADLFLRDVARRPPVVLAAARKLIVTGRTMGAARVLTAAESEQLAAQFRPGALRHATAPPEVVKDTVRRGKASAAKELAKYPELGRPGAVGPTTRVEPPPGSPSASPAPPGSAPPASSGLSKGPDTGLTTIPGPPATPPSPPPTPPPTPPPSPPGGLGAPFSKPLAKVPGTPGPSPTPREERAVMPFESKVKVPAGARVLEQKGQGLEPRALEQKALQQKVLEQRRR
jgi:hypothetical protein